MSITVACPCGARFEVQENSAGKMVECPRCEQPTRAGRGAENPVRTSYFAASSLLLALAGGLGLSVAISSALIRGRDLEFGTAVMLLFAAAVPLFSLLCALAAFVHIRQSQGAVQGKGYAVAAVSVTIFFAAVGILLSMGDGQAIEILREQLASDRVRFDGNLQHFQDDGYSITRPNRRWGVASETYSEETGQSGFILKNPSRQLIVQVASKGGHMDIEAMHREVYDRMRIDAFGRGGFHRGMTLWENVRVVQQPRDWQGQNQTTFREFELVGTIRNVDNRQGELRRRALVRLVRSPDAGFELWGIAFENSFDANKAELQSVLDSFEILPDAWRRR